MRGVWSTAIRRWSYAVGADLILLGAFSALLLVLMGTYRGTWTFLSGSMLLPLIAMLVVLALVIVAKLPELLSSGTGGNQLLRVVLRIVRDWSPLVLILLVYENFHDLTHLIRRTTVDADLRRFDEMLFGVEPTLALDPYVTPWLNEYMTFAYALYLFFPSVMLVRLYARDEFLQFRELGLALSMAYYLGLVGYVTVPAVGPRFFLADAFHTPLTGWLTGMAAEAWSSLESVNRDCFPSLHTAITTVSLIYMWRLRARWPAGSWILAVSAPLIVSLWASTIYLRYHYAVDVLAGWALAFVCCWAAPLLTGWYYDQRSASV